MEAHKPPVNPMLSVPGGAVYMEGDEPYPSLSDNHDYEPNLEFDDTELHHSPDEVIDAVDLLQEMEPEIASPISDYTDENFEDELAEPESNFDSMIISCSYPEVGDSGKYRHIAKYGIVDVKGDDNEGRKIIVVYACKLPDNTKFNHDDFLGYLIETLDKYVEQDYSLIYFHYGLNSKNKPSIRWLWQAYKAFDRKYKKNLKALYMVHPTGFLKLILQMFRPVISVKFGRKLNYISTLAELNNHINVERLSLPDEIIAFDKKLDKSSTKHDGQQLPKEPTDLSPKTQIGCSLQHIKKHQQCDIPPILKQAVEYLDKPELLETEGLFRRSAHSNAMKRIKETANRGEVVTFNDPHEAACIIKQFLRELPEPILGFDNYNEVAEFQKVPKEMQIKQAYSILVEKLPEENYRVLKYLVMFLTRVMDCHDLNKMNASNLAVCIGPNLLWPKDGTMNLTVVGTASNFMQFLLTHHRDIFIV